MSPDALPALFGIAFAATWTPGPNNAMLANSGATFGFRRTVPHVLGVALGFPLMIFAVALGLGQLFQTSALLREVLRWGGAAMLLYIAWRAATAARPGAGRTGGRPFSFVEAAGFQWVNPKAWVMAVGVAAQFVDGRAPLADAAICAAVFSLSGLTSAPGWAGFGVAIGRMLSTPARLRAFNFAMGALIASSVVFLLLADLDAAP